MQHFKAKVCRLYSLEYRSRGRQQGVVLGVRDCLAVPSTHGASPCTYSPPPFQFFFESSFSGGESEKEPEKEEATIYQVTPSCFTEGGFQRVGPLRNKPEKERV